MQHFPILTTKRLKAQMRELTIMQSIAVAKYPDANKEASITYMLSCIAPDAGDPLTWTLQERYLALAHYLMCINTKEPDFPIGRGVLSDYLYADKDIDPATINEPVLVGDVGGDVWGMGHLYGYMLESIERTQGLTKNAETGEPLDPMLHWIFGAQACQLVRVETAEDGSFVRVITDQPDPADVGAFDDWLIAEILTRSQFPDNAFSTMRVFHAVGQSRMLHLFDWAHGIDGRPVFLPHSSKEAAAVLPPATFSPDECISPAAREMGGKPL